MKRQLVLAFVICNLAFVILIGGCSRSEKALQIKGSDTMVNLAQAWAEEFMSRNPDIPVAVTGGGSGTGIAALIGKATDIAQCSREIKDKEIKLAEKHGVRPVEFHPANDGIAVVVHPLNPVNKLTIRQLSGIFTGEITNWKELGGQDLKIVALSRERNSGTHVFFLEEVVKLGDKKSKNEFAAGTLMMPSSQAIVEEVSGNPSAIGYFGLGYLTGKQKALAVARKEGGPFILPTIATIKNRTYPISRSLLFYTNGRPEGKIKKFIDFTLSPEGQKIVLKMDFVPARPAGGPIR
jgi:phosphate transport system substrate-binding protein